MVGQHDTVNQPNRLTPRTYGHIVGNDPMLPKKPGVRKLADPTRFERATFAFGGRSDNFAPI